MPDLLLIVAPNGFGAAAERVGDEIPDLVRLAIVELVDSLAGCAGMAGSDDAGAAWGSSYDETAGQLLGGAADLVDSCYRLATLLEQTGLNYAAADAVSARGAAPASASTWRARSAARPVAPSAVGAGISAPPGWGLVAHLIGHLWPDGHQDRLHAAARAWQLFAAQLSDVASYVDLAVTEVRAQRVPEVEPATAVLSQLRARADELTRVAHSVATTCEDYAHHVDDAHHKIIEQLTELLATIAASEAIGLGLSLISAGASEAAAQLEVAAEVSRAAAVVRTLVIEVIAVCRAGAAVLADLVEDVLGARVAFAGMMARETEIGEFLRPGAMFSSRIPEEDRLVFSTATTPQDAAMLELRTAADAPRSWDDPSKLWDHFKRHGADFDAPSPNGYAEQAQLFLKKALRERFPMKLDRSDGVIRVYDPETNTFGSYTLNGTRTNTFFKPRRGLAYWNDQSGVSDD